MFSISAVCSTNAPPTAMIGPAMAAPTADMPIPAERSVSPTSPILVLIVRRAPRSFEGFAPIST